jgi:malic enzyme
MNFSSVNEIALENKVVVFGAGAAGKGLIGPLFAQAGYDVTFVDIKDDLIDRRIDGKAIIYPHRRTTVMQSVPSWTGADEERYLREGDCAMPQNPN